MKPRNKEKIYLYERDHKKCFHCGKSLYFRQITLDHYLPISKGGTNDLFNLVIACKKCNKGKGAKVPQDYRDAILNLFLQAVEDGMIMGKGLSIDNTALKEDLLEVKRIENITDQFVFQSDTMRFYVKDNRIVKMVYLGGSR